jgi:hypothetical protein
VHYRIRNCNAKLLRGSPSHGETLLPDMHAPRPPLLGMGGNSAGPNSPTVARKRQWYESYETVVGRTLGEATKVL